MRNMAFTLRVMSPARARPPGLATRARPPLYATRPGQKEPQKDHENVDARRPAEDPAPAQAGPGGQNNTTRQAQGRSQGVGAGGQHQGGGESADQLGARVQAVDEAVAVGGGLAQGGPVLALRVARFGFIAHGAALLPEKTR